MSKKNDTFPLLKNASYSAERLLNDWLVQNPKHARDYNNAHKILLRGARLGLLDQVKTALSLKADVNTLSSKALIDALDNGHIDVARYLIDQGSDYLNQSGFSIALMAEQGAVDLIETVFKNIDKNTYGMPELLLNFAALGDQLDVLRYVQENWFDLEPSDTENAIKNALQEGHINSLKFICENFPYDPSKICPHLISAIIQEKPEHKKCIEYILPKFLEVAPHDSSDRLQVLTLLIRHNFDDLAEAVIKDGLDFSKYDEYKQPDPLAWAVANKNIKMVKTILNSDYSKEEAKKYFFTVCDHTHHQEQVPDEIVEAFFPIFSKQELRNHQGVSRLARDGRLDLLRRIHRDVDLTSSPTREKLRGTNINVSKIHIDEMLLNACLASQGSETLEFLLDDLKYDFSEIAPSDQLTFIAAATQTGHLDTIDLLCKKGFYRPGFDNSDTIRFHMFNTCLRHNNLDKLQEYMSDFGYNAEDLSLLLSRSIMENNKDFALHLMTLSPKIDLSHFMSDLASHYTANQQAMAWNDEMVTFLYTTTLPKKELQDYLWNIASGYSREENISMLINHGYLGFCPSVDNLASPKNFDILKTLLNKTDLIEQDLLQKIAVRAIHKYNTETMEYLFTNHKIDILSPAVLDTLFEERDLLLHTAFLDTCDSLETLIIRAKEWTQDHNNLPTKADFKTLTAKRKSGNTPLDLLAAQGRLKDVFNGSAWVDRKKEMISTWQSGLMPRFQDDALLDVAICELNQKEIQKPQVAKALKLKKRRR